MCGFPFDFRMGYGRQFGRSTKVIAINRDPAALTKNRTPTLAVESDAGRFLESLSERVSVTVPDWIAVVVARRPETTDDRVLFENTTGVSRIGPRPSSVPSQAASPVPVKDFFVGLAVTMPV